MKLARMVIQGILPKPILYWLSALNRRIQITLGKYPQLAEDRSYYSDVGYPEKVMVGPFQGMKYINDNYYGRFMMKVLGTYELELRDGVEELVGLGADVIVNAGAAEGFYAVGIALRCPKAQVISYEARGGYRRLLRKMIHANGVKDRVIVRGFCDIDALHAALEKAKSPMVICDIEGGEDTLLDPKKVDKLRISSILVESHVHLRPGVTDRLRQRFESTHTIKYYKRMERTVADVPCEALPRLGETKALSAITEYRNESAEWLIMIPKK